MNKITSGQVEFTTSPGRSDTGHAVFQWVLELWLGESVDDLEKMKCSQYVWYGMYNFNSTTWQNKSNEWISKLGHAGFTTLLSRSSTGHSSTDEEMRCSQHEWYEMDDFIGTERQSWVQVMLYKIYNNRFAKRGFTIVFTQVRKARIHN